MASDHEEAPKDSESSSDKGGGIKGESFGTNFWEKIHYLKNISRHKR